MTAVRIFNPPNRLAKIVEGHDGVAFNDLVTASERRIEDLQDDIREYVREEVKRIVGIYAHGEEIMFARCKELGDAAMNVADVAGAAKLCDLGEVAGGIRAMIDSLFGKGVWHTDALEAHITSLILFNAESPSKEEADKVLSRLSKMRAAVGVVE